MTTKSYSRSSDVASAPEELPQHLVRLPGSDWALWRWVCVRGAGFAAAQVLELASLECAAAADDLIQATDHEQRLRREALKGLWREFKQAGGGERATLKKVINQVEKGRPVQPIAYPPSGGAAIEAVAEAASRVRLASDDFGRSFEVTTTQLSQRLCQLAGEDRFREAIIWQNRRALHTCLDVLLKEHTTGASKRSKRRHHEGMVANYLQRYCTKNETIGFFGPVGWARLDPDVESLRVLPDKHFVANHKTFFEGWCVDALANKLGENSALRPWLAPQRAPFIHIEGVILHQPTGSPIPLSDKEASLLSACDGERTAKEIATDLLERPGLHFENEEEVYALLEKLCSKRLIWWALGVPIEIHPERTLRKMLDRVNDDALRVGALAALTEIEEKRDAVNKAAGDADRLDRAMGDLEETFTRLTATAATRSEGRTYAGRTLVYHECQRQIEVMIGSDILEKLGPPLSLLLASARWFTAQVASTYRKAFEEIYSELALKAGSPVVDFGDFWFRTQRILFGASTCLVNNIVPVFQQRWESVLSPPQGNRYIEYTSREIRPLVLREFDAPKAGWKSARYHSPDLMIAAAGTDAINNGEYHLVIGELHMAVNTLGTAFLMAQHPRPQELTRAAESDLPLPRVVPVTPKFWPKQTARTNYALLSPKDYRLESAVDPSGAEKTQRLTVGELVIEDTEGGLVVRTRDYRLQFDVIEFFGETFNIVIGSLFKLLGPRPHTPRIAIDRLVIYRESWCFALEELEFAYEKDEATRFVNARRWAHSHELPRFVFVKVPTEIKPFYLDFDSPVYVTMFTKVIRKIIEADLGNPIIAISEMFPGPDQLWLPDSEGRLYTSELRSVAVDLSA